MLAEFAREDLMLFLNVLFTHLLYVMVSSPTYETLETYAW